MPLNSIRIRTELTGESELLMHNIQLADPSNYWTKQIARLTGKRKMTEEDHQSKARLEFLGSLYVQDNKVVVPQANIKRCFKEAAKATRQGRHIDRALNFAEPGELARRLAFPDMDKTPDELYAIDRYRDTTIVASPGRVPRTRPRFPAWGVDAEWMLFPGLLSLEDFKEITASAGLIEGLGDNRVNGMGRFTCTVTVVEGDE